jgi:hypothetical protein
MITCLFWPDEQYTYLKLHFMLYKKRWGSQRFSLRGQYYHIFTYSIQYYQIRIGSDPHNFAGSGSSQLISIQAHLFFLLFHENFNMLSKIPVWRISNPDFYPFRMPDPGSRIPDLGSRIQKQQQERGVKHNFLCSYKFHKTENYFSFEVLKKKI